MFKNSSKIINRVEDLSNYVSGIDVYNSALLDKLRDPGINRELYEITSFEYRPDLISEDYYGSPDYLGLLLIQGARGLEDYKKGEVLRLIPKSTLDNIISNL